MSLANLISMHKLATTFTIHMKLSNIINHYADGNFNWYIFKECFQIKNVKRKLTVRKPTRTGHSIHTHTG